MLSFPERISPSKTCFFVGKPSWVALRTFWSGWRKPLVLVTHRTVVIWHRAGFRSCCETSPGCDRTAIDAGGSWYRRAWRVGAEEAHCGFRQTRVNCSGNVLHVEEIPPVCRWFIRPGYRTEKNPFCCEGSTVSTLPRADILGSRPAKERRVEGECALGIRGLEFVPCNAPKIFGF
jgi:hypothetical protein